MFNGVKGADHIGIPTVKPEESFRFYEELGFRCTSEIVMEGRGALRFYEAGDVCIELIPAKETNPADGAVNHFAVSVDSADETYEFCLEKGYEMLNDRVLFLKGFRENGIKCFNIKGPNGEKIEFVERL